MFANWGQIKMGNSFKTMQINHNNLYIYIYIVIFYVVDTCSKFDFWFQIFIIQISNILVKLIAC